MGQLKVCCNSASARAGSLHAADHLQPCQQPGVVVAQRLQRLAAQMAAHRLRWWRAIDQWLVLGSRRRRPLRRLLALIRRLQGRFGGGGDVATWVQREIDPGLDGQLHPAGLAPWQRLGLSPFTTAAAAVMDWTGMDGSVLTHRRPDRHGRRLVEALRRRRSDGC